MTSSWASVPRTRAPRAEALAPPCTRAGVRSTALAASGGLLALSAAACATSLLSSAPVQAQEPVQTAAVTAAPSSAPSRAHSVRFDYSAAVRPNEVYDTARAQAPAPLFRALVQSVDVAVDYTGPAARLQLVARLSSTTGWSTTVPLAGPVDVDGRGRVHAPLALDRLEQRGAVVAQQTGMPFEGMTVELVAVVRHGGGTWRPAVALQLTAQQLRLAGDPATLTVAEGADAGASGTATPAAPTPASRLTDLLGWRPSGLLTTFALTLAAGGGVAVVRRRREEDDADRARRRLGRLLVETRPSDLDGLRVVQVASPDELARLAERYGLLVLHWTEAGTAVFVVQDDGTAYRWTTADAGSPASAAAEVPASGERPAEQDPVDRELLEAARLEVERREAARQEAARQEAARQVAARLEAARQERLRREAERRRAAEVAEQARAQAARAQAARVEAERVEQRLRDAAEQAQQAWLDLERAHSGSASAATVPAPREACEDAALADGPPRQAR